jgi:hypothetical protein
MEIRVEARVQCSDGPGGETTHLIVHPGTKKVTRLVVKGASAPHVERVVPYSFIEESAGDQIRLRCSRHELSKMQSLVRTELVGSSWAEHERVSAETERVKRPNISEGECIMDAHTQVRATDGKAGRVGGLMVDPSSGKISHLVLRERAVWARKAVMVPIEDVRQMGAKTVYLRTEKAGIEALPAVPVLRG